MGYLKTVTISGADDKVKIADLVALSFKFPFVEWGILASPKNHGKPRYPKMEWLMDIGMVSAIKKSIHLCGDYARIFAINGDANNICSIINDFDRCQINLGNQLDRIDPEFLVRNMFNTPVTEYILQMPNDSPESIIVLDNITRSVHELAPHINIFPFLDASGGKGITEQKWQMNTFCQQLPRLCRWNQCQ
jgi:hypothetical protein